MFDRETTAWHSYVPYHVARDLLLRPDAVAPDHEQRFDAVALFADVSGFTAISEALATLGKVGAEELTRSLNIYFEPMIALIQSYGGIVGKFGGDALTVLFPYDTGTRATVCHRAVHCALEMQRRMPGYAAIATPAGEFGLAMKAGLASGPVFCDIIGDPAIRQEYIIAGSPLDECAEAEHHAVQGEVVVHSSLLEATGAEIEATPVAGSYWRVTGVSRPAVLAPLPPLGLLPPATTRQIATFLHPSIAHRIEEGRASFINEHRKVTVLFVAFTEDALPARPYDYDGDNEVGTKLRGYMAQVIRIVQRYDGYLNKVDMGDKGSKYIVLFGAPVAHENDVDRALRCALELCALPAVRTRAGINTGFVFCGQVGSALRQEYTVIGDAVNLAARLMQAALPGQILVGESTYADSSAATFAWERMAPLKIRGKSNLAEVHVLVGFGWRAAFQLHEAGYALPMVGREDELRFVAERLEWVMRGQGQIIGITGEAGIGKSRLVAEILHMAHLRGLRAFGGECPSYGANSSYLIWWELITGLLNLDPSQAAEAQQHHAEARLTAIDPALTPRAPLLGPVLHITIPDTPLTQSLDPRLRKASLEALIVDLIRAEAQGDSGAGEQESRGQGDVDPLSPIPHPRSPIPDPPIMLVLEDAHWIDPLSDDLLEAVGRAIADLPLLLLVVYRTPESEAPRPRVARLSHFSEIRLGEFSRTEAERLIGLKVTQLYQGQDRTGPVPGTTEPAAHASPQAPPDLVKQIVARAQGNPFYIDEMLNLIHTRGIDLSDTDSAEALDLPDSLHSLIISRIDQLDEDVKATLKVASVIGRLFKASWLWGIYPQLGAPERVTAQLDQLNRQALIALDRPEPELEYLFRHIVTREVAYASLSVATRARLHQQIGRYIEQTYTETLEQYVDLLAYHYGLSPDRDKQREYFRRAGMAAQAAYANETAIEYYRRLLPLLPDTERSEWMLRLGEIQQLTGEWAAAEATYIQALDSAGDLCARAGCQQALGRLQVGKGAYADALAWLEQARASYRALGDEQNFAAALQQIGVVYWSQNAFHDALQCFEQYLSFVERTGDQRGLSVVTNNIGLVYWNLDQLDRALQSLERSLQIATALDDRMRTGIAVGNMGNIYQAQGDLEHALSCYARNLQIALDIGDRLGIGIAVGNMGSIYQVRGDYAYALACYARNLQIALDIGDRPGAGMSSWSIAESLIARGDYEQAGRFLAGAITIGQALESPYELSDYLLTEVDRLTRLGQYSYALHAAEEAQRRANEADRTEVAFRARLSQITLRATLGRIDRAAAQEAYQHLLAEGDEAQQADVLYAAWRLDPADEEARRQAVELYRVRYAHASDAEVRRRLIELTGEHPPDPPALPAPPEIVTRDPAPLHGLLARIDALIAEPAGPPEESVVVGG